MRPARDRRLEARATGRVDVQIGRHVHASRARLKRELVTGSPGWWNIVEAAGGWDGVVLVNARNPENAKYEQKSIAAVARETGKDPADAAWDLVAQGRGRVMAIYHMMGEADIETALRIPWTSIGSDAGAIAVAAGGDDLEGDDDFDVPSFLK